MGKNKTKKGAENRGKKLELAKTERWEQVCPTYQPAFGWIFTTGQILYKEYRDKERQVANN